MVSLLVYLGPPNVFFLSWTAQINDTVDIAKHLLETVRMADGFLVCPFPFTRPLEQDKRIDSFWLKL